MIVGDEGQFVLLREQGSLFFRALGHHDEILLAEIKTEPEVNDQADKQAEKDAAGNPTLKPEDGHHRRQSGQGNGGEAPPAGLDDSRIGEVEEAGIRERTRDAHESSGNSGNDQYGEIDRPELLVELAIVLTIDAELGVRGAHGESNGRLEG